MLMAVYRQSYGFGRKTTGDWLSLSFLQRYTGLSRTRCSKALSELRTAGMIARVRVGDTSTASEYAPVKDYAAWSDAILPDGWAPVGSVRNVTSDAGDTSDAGRTRGSDAGGTTQKTRKNQEENNPPTPRKRGSGVSADVQKAWDALRIHRPSLSETPPKTGQKELIRAVADVGADGMETIWAWAHKSDHKRAVFLREHSGGLPSWVSVCRKAGEYLEYAEAWKAGTPTQDKAAWLADWRESLDAFDSACRFDGFARSADGFHDFISKHRKMALPVPDDVIALVQRRIARNA